MKNAKLFKWHLCLLIVLVDFCMGFSLENYIDPNELKCLQQGDNAYQKSIPEDVGSHAFFQKIEDLYKKNNLSNLKNQQNNGYKIPPIIHFILLGKDDGLSSPITIYRPLLKLSEQALNDWRRYYRGWDIIVWDEKQIKEKFSDKLFNQKIYDEALSMSDYATMSKIVRYEILYKYGGVFVEPVVRSHKFLRQLHEKYHFYAGLETLRSYGVISNKVIGAQREHPIIKKCIDLIKQADNLLIARSSTLKSWFVHHLGSAIITKAAYEKIDQDADLINIVFPPHSFFYKKKMQSPFFSSTCLDDLSSVTFIATSYPKKEKPFVVVIASYNNKVWCKRNLVSVLMQNYHNYRIIYVDDASSDGTGDLVENFMQEHGFQDKITLIKNTERQGAGANFYKASQLCKDEEIMVHLDGDDWLAHEHVFEVLNKVYEDSNVWMTYGQHQGYPFLTPGHCNYFPSSVIEENKFREWHWTYHHLRTSYSWLFKLVKREDLQINGLFLPSSWDAAANFAMLEMAGKRVKFLHYLLYMYNRASQLNDDKINRQLQYDMEMYARSQKRYNRLEQKPSLLAIE